MSAWCEMNVPSCGIFLSPAINHPCCVLAAGREKKRGGVGWGGAESEEGGAATVAPSWNMSDAKVAGMEEKGGGGRRSGGGVGTSSSQPNNLHEWTVTYRASLTFGQLYLSLCLFLSLTASGVRCSEFFFHLSLCSMEIIKKWFSCACIIHSIFLVCLCFCRFCL